MMSVSEIETAITELPRRNLRSFANGLLNWITTHGTRRLKRMRRRVNWTRLPPKRWRNTMRAK